MAARSSAAAVADLARTAVYRARVSARAGVGLGRDARDWYSGQPTSPQTYRTMRILHRHTAGMSSRVAVSLLKAVPGSVDRTPSPAADLDAAWKRAIVPLNRDGIAFLPPILDAPAVARIRAFAQTAPAFTRAADGSSRACTYRDRRDGDAVIEIVDEFVLRQPDIQHVLSDPRVHAFARRHFGIGAVLHRPMLWWSCVGSTPVDDSTRMMLARSFHWDYDGLRSLRLNVYLTTVGEGSAPMRYVSGSHRVGALRTAALRAADHGVDEPRVERAFGSGAVRTVTGPAGTTFITDSSGLHAGTTPTIDDRLFLVFPMQATGFAGFQVAARPVVPHDERFATALAGAVPELRLFEPAR